MDLRERLISALEREHRDELELAPAHERDELRRDHMHEVNDVHAGLNWLQPNEMRAIESAIEALVQRAGNT